jgi:uncharacterized Zn finger protein
MTVDESTIRDLCTEAVFERGETYRAEGRIHDLSRFGDTVTATVQGSRSYDLTLDLSATAYDPRCSCPYDGPGVCKHVVAVLLDLADGLPTDEREPIDGRLESISNDALREFVRDELARDSSMRERFLAQFGDGDRRSVDEYRADIDQLFDEHTQEYPVVVDAIDFSRFTDLATRYRERENYRQAATIYRALAEGIDENMDLVDAAYDHYAKVFTTALDGYVECVVRADFETGEQRAHVEFLSERATSGTDYLQEYYEDALADIRSRENDDHQ